MVGLLAISDCMIIVINIPSRVLLNLTVSEIDLQAFIICLYKHLLIFLKMILLRTTSACCAPFNIRLSCLDTLRDVCFSENTHSQSYEVFQIYQSHRVLGGVNQSLKSTQTYPLLANNVMSLSVSQ